MTQTVDHIYKVLEEHFWRNDSDASDHAQRLYIQTAAKQVLDAIRDPTDGMIDAFYETYPMDCGPIPIWQSMVDAAIKEAS